MLKRVPAAFDESLVHSADELEHGAVLELLLLVIYADRCLSNAEQRALEAFDAEHADWDTATFSLQQYLGPATAAVRRALASPAAVEALLDEIDARVTTPELRADLPRLSRVIAGIDGDVAPSEEAFIALVDARFAG